MTEKEIAEKVWEWFDKEVIHCMVNEDGIPYEAGVSHVSGKLEKILPRPKREVKKEMWANIHRDEDGDYEVGEIVLYDTKEQADSWCHPGSKLATAKVTFEVEG